MLLFSLLLSLKDLPALADVDTDIYLLTPCHNLYLVSFNGVNRVYNNMDSEYLRKENSLLQQRILFLESQLSQLKSSESVLSSKLQQINSSRTAILEKLSDLSKQYEEKIRHLESKVDKLARQNQGLLKQGNSYREEIELFENRILEKERLLTSFVTEGGFGGIQSYERVGAGVLKGVGENYEQVRGNEDLNEENQGEIESGGILRVHEQEQRQPPPPPPSMRQIEEEPRKQEVERRVPPPPIRSKAPQTQPKEKRVIPEVVETIAPTHPPAIPSPPKYVPEYIEEVENIGSSKNLQESENFFNQLASNSFVSEIVPRDDNPHIPDTPFSHSFQPHNLEQSEFSQGQNFFDNLAQSQQFQDYSLQPNQFPAQPTELFPDTRESQNQEEPRRNQVNEMMAPPKLVQPKKNKRDRLQVMNSSSFQF